MRHRSRQRLLAVMEIVMVPEAGEVAWALKTSTVGLVTSRLTGALAVADTFPALSLAQP